MKISILASEAVPFAKTGGLADVVTALGKELVKLGHDVTLMLPKYQGIGNIMPTGLISPLKLSFGKRNVTYALIEAMHEGVKVVFVDAPQYFERNGIYGDQNGDFGDNDERYVFFSRACLDYYKRKERPDVFHCNDWQTALVPLFLKTHYYHDPISTVPVLFTIHNMAYQGVFPGDRYHLLDLGPEYMSATGIEFFGHMNFMKSGLLYSDVITTVSRKYSQEIQTPDGGYKLDGIVRQRAERVFGILNGIDEDVWSPQKDQHIAQRYSVDNLEGKSACRRELLEICRWDPNTRWPILAIISRLASQKGLDLLEHSMERILSMHYMLVVLGTGEARYEKLFGYWARRNPSQVTSILRFDNPMAHKIEAGADMFLMPSRYEPCGLNQMYSLKYGTVPVVRGTGGLDDTVHEWNPSDGSGNGFKFYDYNSESMIDALARARNVYEKKDAWYRIMRNGMVGDYSWRNSAIQYAELYQQAMRLRS